MSAVSLRAAVLTPSGRGAVATIQVTGNLMLLDDCFRAVHQRSITQLPLNKICYGNWGAEPAEDVVVVRIAKHAAEVHCHGGNAAVTRLLADIQTRSGEIVTWQTLADNQSLLELESEAALLKATTLKTAKLLLRQRQLYPQTMHRLASLSPSEQLAETEQMLLWSNFGIHLSVPWQVVLCGRPNVGKSSLINALVGYNRSVVFDQPGTTRDVVSEQTALSGWPIEFSDTAGIRDTIADIESQGIRRAKERLQQADLQILVIDASIGFTNSDYELMQAYPDALVVMNKSDIALAANSNSQVKVSALSGEGIEKLQQVIVSRLIPEVPAESITYPVTQSQLLFIRKLNHSLKEALR